MSNAERHRRWRKANPEKDREGKRRWQEANRERANATKRRYAEAHPERVVAAKARYKEANQEKVDASKRRWEAEHPQEVLANARAYREANRDKTRAATQRWQILNREKKAEASARRRARRLGSFVENVNRMRVWERDQGRCGICGEPADETGWHLDHMTPLARDGEHSFANTQVTHATCNFAKGTRLVAA